MNCTIQRSRMFGSDELEVIAGSRSSVKLSAKKFRVDEETAVLNLSGAVELKCVEEVKDVAGRLNL